MTLLPIIKKFYMTLGYFKDDFHPLHHLVTQYIADMRPKNVFEFGAAWGKNSILLHKLDNSIKYSGLDINPVHIDMAKERGFNVWLGDEETLKEIPAKTYEISFTSSVLTHFPQDNVKAVVDQLVRISSKAVIACESIDWDGGYDLRETTRRDNSKSFWFRHDYKKLGYRDTKEYAWSSVSNAYYKIYRRDIF